MQERHTASYVTDADATATAHQIVTLAADKKASDIVLLDIRRLTTIADYFVILNGTSTRQIRALAGSIDEALDEEGVAPLHREGDAEDGWVLLDYGHIVVHIFSPEKRHFYALEALWHDAATVVHIQ